jgi:hypothetical protein
MLNILVEASLAVLVASSLERDLDSDDDEFWGPNKLWIPSRLKEW